jgi:hypothetical protein
MIERRTTLIIGAGASAECGLPVGAELKERIARLLDIRFNDWGDRQVSGDPTICEALRGAAASNTPPERGIDSYLQAAWQIRNAMPQALSIDNFIDTQQGNARLELCGKLAIVRSVLDAEAKSQIYLDPHHNKQSMRFESLQATWFTSFFQLLTENCRPAQLEHRFSALTLIIFNYDRCVEHFLYHALQNYYGISATEAAALVSSIGIFHPYGTVGALPWQSRRGSVAFGADTNSRELGRLAGQIRTFTEGTDPTQSAIEEIRRRVFEAQIVLFLGFAYHRLNLQLIWSDGMPHAASAEAKYFGTALGLSQSDCEEIIGELSALGGTPANQIHIRNSLTCAKLFGEYWRSLSLSRFGD